MTDIVGHFEPVVLCLAASLLWAPLVLAGALRLDRGRSRAATEVVWVAALFVAALPTLAAPALSAAGLSLRAPEVIELTGPAIAAAAPVVNTLPDVAEPAPSEAFRSPPLTLKSAIAAAGLVYLYGALLALGLYLFRGVLFARQVGAARPVRHPELLGALNDYARRLGVAADFSVRQSDAVSTVCVFGVVRPVILMPTDIAARLSFQDLVLMGAHELAHIRRGDAFLYAFAEIVRIAFWFNPFMREVAARAELAAEQGADALVLAGGADRRRYAACFIEGLKFAAERAQAARFATPSFTPFDRQSRRDRLNAILSGETPEARPSFRLLAALAAVLACGAAFAQAGLAVTPAPEIRRSFEPDIEISARRGEPLRAPEAGLVVEATDVYKGRPSLGKVVVLRHDGGRTTLFSHLDSYSVRKGDRVARGDAVGVGGADSSMTFNAEEEPVDRFARAEPREPVIPKPPEPADAAPLPPIPPAADDIAPADDVDPLDSALAGADLGAATAHVDRHGPDSAASYTFLAPGGSAYVFETKDGRTALAFRKSDGTVVTANGRPLTAEETKRFEQQFEALRQRMEKTRAKHSGSFEGFFSDGVHLDHEALSEAGKLAAEHARDLAEKLKHGGFSARDRERIERAAERALRFAERGGDFADFSFSWNACDDGCRAAIEDERRQAEEERREALAEAEEARAEALAEAEAARAEALAEAEAARAEALAEAEAERAEAEEERRSLEAEIRERAEALAEAERELADERAEIERLRDELAAKRDGGASW